MLYKLLISITKHFKVLGLMRLDGQLLELMYTEMQIVLDVTSSFHDLEIFSIAVLNLSTLLFARQSDLMLAASIHTRVRSNMGSSLL